MLLLGLILTLAVLVKMDYRPFAVFVLDSDIASDQGLWKRQGATGGSYTIRAEGIDT